MNMFDISCDTLGIIVGCQTKVLQQYMGRHFTLMDLYVTNQFVCISGSFLLSCRVSSGCCARARPHQKHVMKSFMSVVMLSCGAEGRQKQQVLYRCCVASLLTHLFWRSALCICAMNSLW